MSVVGDWNGWDGRVHPMRSLGSSGVWELFLPGVEPGARYKYEIRGADGSLRLKADPMAQAAERPPLTASEVFRSVHSWRDGDWMAERLRRHPHAEPVSIYEVHLPSWRWNPEQGNRPLDLRRAGRGAGRLRPRHGLHPRGAAARDGPSVLGLVGLPGDLLLRADAHPRLPRRPARDGRPPARAGHRRDPRLGAGALPARRLRARAPRRHRPLRARGPAPRARTPTGAR